MNTFGSILRLTTFGESHGPAMGGILDGFPSCFEIDFGKVMEMLARRRPGNGIPGTSTRKETDIPEFLSGFSSEGITLGTPIGFIIRNVDARSRDYDSMADVYRPNHADYTYDKKYGIRDVRGGGRASARETVSWVVAGALCMQWLEARGINIKAEATPGNDVRETQLNGDSTGGYVDCIITGLPVGIGEPVGEKLHVRLASAMMSINAAKAFEYGDGFNSAHMLGSESVDSFTSRIINDKREVYTVSNHSGGIQGGISNGMPVNMRVYFKPTPTILQPVATVDKNGMPATLRPRGRHDACVALRATPIVEAMAALTVMDMILLSMCHGPV